MNTYYVVTTRIDDKGKVLAFISGTVQAETEPETTENSTSRYDFYHDYFETKREANEFIKMAQMI